MATRQTSCENCSSTNVTDINPEVKDTATTPIVKVKAKCNDCETEFEYSSATAHGRKRGILY